MRFNKGISNDGLRRIAKEVKTVKAQDSDEGPKGYWDDVKSIAEEVRDAIISRGISSYDVYDRVHEQVNGSQYIIYYAKNIEVLNYTKNEDALDFSGTDLNTSDGWRNILTQYAYFAMMQDVKDEIGDVDSLGMEEDEEDEEEEY